MPRDARARRQNASRCCGGGWSRQQAGPPPPPPPNPPRHPPPSFLLKNGYLSASLARSLPLLLHSSRFATSHPPLSSSAEKSHRAASPLPPRRHLSRSKPSEASSACRRRTVSCPRSGARDSCRRITCGCVRVGVCGCGGCRGGGVNHGSCPRRQPKGCPGEGSADGVRAHPDGVGVERVRGEEREHQRRRCRAQRRRRGPREVAAGAAGRGAGEMQREVSARPRQPRPRRTPLLARTWRGPTL